MPRGMSALSEFSCFTCGKTLGYTAPGEAGRINVRAHVYCEVCKDAPAGLTDRQQQLIAVLAAQKERGDRPTLSKAAEEMKISRSRVQQISTAIKARGADNEIDAVMFGRTPPSAVEVSTLPSREELSSRMAPLQVVPNKGESWEYDTPEYAPPVPSSTPDVVEDPAMFGGDFVV